MAGQSGHNLKISKHRLGCRLPFETTKSDGDGYAKAGEVKIYHLTPEEIAARYGPPRERQLQRQHLTATHLLDAIAASSGPEDAAELLGMPVVRFKTECTLRGIRKPQYGIPRKEAENVARWEEFNAKLTKDTYLEFKRQGLSDAKILKTVGLNYNGYTNCFTKAKKDWGLAGLNLKALQINSGAETLNPPSAPEAGPVSELNPDTKQDPETQPEVQQGESETPPASVEVQPELDDDIIFMVPNKTCGKPIIKIEEGRGIRLNRFACRLLGGTEYVRIGVKNGQAIILPSTTEEGSFKLKSRDKVENTKIGGGGLVKQLLAAGVKPGKYQLVFNKERGRLETVVS